jgi:hypothetical protein
MRRPGHLLSGHVGSLRRLLTKSVMILNSLINYASMTRPWTAEERDVMAPSATSFAQPDAAALLAQAEYERFIGI